MLGVSPNTLRSWERRFGFPAPRRSAGGHRQFDLAEIEALRQALEETHNVSSAVSIARERGSGPSSPMRLKSLLSRFDEAAADRLVEESLAVRSMERTVEEILLPAVGALGEGRDRTSPEYGFGWRWATGWLAAQTRTAPAGAPRRGRPALRRDARARPRRAPRAGARDRAAPGRPARPDAPRRPRPAADRPRARRADAERGRPRRPERLPRHLRAPGLRGAPLGRGRRASTTSAARCPRPARRPCRGSASARWPRARSCSPTSTSSPASRAPRKESAAL